MPIKNSRIFTVSPWEKLHEFIKDADYSAVFLLCDQETHRHCLPYFQSKCPDLNCVLTIIPNGERIKNLETVQSIWNQWLAQGIDRNTLVVCLGGGVVCDIGGFCAHTILRGVDCIYIPTSLMAMADAAIGGKTGINFNLYKNQIGAFVLPKAIVIDPAFLDTLAERELRNGYVEIIKHSLIQNPPYIQNLQELGWPIAKSDLLEYLKKSIRTKTEIVEQDYKEQGIRKILNYGHTLGHALETHYLIQNQEVLHGEAVAAGMICESFISSSLFRWKPNILEPLCSFLKNFTGNVEINPENYEEILQIGEMDKKKRKQTLMFSLLESPGKPRINQTVPVDIILKSLEYYN